MAESAITKLTKTHRYRLRDFLCTYLYQYPNDGLRSIFDSGSKDQYNAFVSDISRLGLNDLQSKFPELGANVYLLTSGKIRDEVLRVIGQIKNEFPKCSSDILRLPSFEAKMHAVYEMYQCLKGKRKAEVDAAPPKWRACNRDTNKRDI